jgi:hypothetical protein
MLTIFFADKTYHSTEHENQRRVIFKKNLEKVNKHNSNGTHTYTLAMNKFSDLTEEEFITSYMGYKKPDNNTVLFFNFT